MCVYCKGNALEGLASDYFPTHSLRLSPTALVSNNFSQHLRDSLAWGDGETVNYYIETQSSYGQGWYGDQWYLEDGTWFQSVGQGSEDIAFITDIFTKLDPLIDLDFKRKYTYDGTNFDIYSVDYVSNWEINGGIVGQVFQQFSGGAWWDIFWKDTDGSFSLNDFDKNSIIHEIGHALGLSHPNEDPTNPNWNTDDTVMSYNQSPDGWDYWFSETDIAALQSIWGREDDNPAATSTSTLTESNDNFAGDTGNNLIIALYGDDIIDAGAGDDVLYGNQGNDKIIAGTGEDKLYGGQGADTLYGNQGDDTLYGNIEGDFLYGGQGTDNLYGNQGADRLYGNKGDDVLYGGKDKDYLDGGEGDDILYGNIGGDCFYLSAGEDKVMDFNASDGDWILIPDSTCSLVQQGDNLLVNAASGNLLIANHSLENFNGNIVAA